MPKHPKDYSQYCKIGFWGPKPSRHTYLVSRQVSIETNIKLLSLKLYIYNIWYNLQIEYFQINLYLDLSRNFLYNILFHEDFLKQSKTFSTW